MIIKFEGIYMNSFVYVNGQLAAKCPYGYTGFYVELNDYVKYGEENEIRVSVRNSAMTNSRWYSGGGIYRDVYFMKSGLTYIVPEGVYVTTENIEEQAVIKITGNFKNRNCVKEDVLVKTEIMDKNGNLFVKITTL